MSTLRSLLALTPEQLARYLADQAVIWRAGCYDVRRWRDHWLAMREREDLP